MKHWHVKQIREVRAWFLPGSPLSSKFGDVVGGTEDELVLPLGDVVKAGII